MLKPEFKEKFVAALESGEYKQTQSVLYDGSGYCCLGVAAKLMGATFVEKSGFDADGASDWFRAMLDGVDLGDGEGLLSEDSCAIIGLNYSEEMPILYKMNDAGKTFNEIAEYTRNNL